MNRLALMLFVLVSCAGLASCGEKNSDLKKFVAESDKMPRDRIPPIPEVKPYEPFTYNAYDLLDPFKPREIIPPKGGGGGGLQPNLTRHKEPLEAFPLENLKMVGTLQQGNTTYAIIKTPDNDLFRVKPGNYMGQNFGVITAIDESTIHLKEIIQDSTGDWAERISTMTLVEGQ